MRRPTSASTHITLSKVRNVERLHKGRSAAVSAGMVVFVYLETGTPDRLVGGGGVSARYPPRQGDCWRLFSVISESRPSGAWSGGTRTCKPCTTRRDGHPGSVPGDTRRSDRRCPSASWTERTERTDRRGELHLLLGGFRRHEDKYR